MIHLGPHFPSFFSHNSATNPDKIFSNKHHYLNCMCEPGELTSSDHLLVIFKLSTTPFITEEQKVYQTHKADWELFKHKLDSQISVTNLDNNSVEQLENATKNWIKVVKNAMDTAIPKSTFKFTYQLKTTPEIRNLETQFKNLKEFAEFLAGLCRHTGNTQE